VPQALSFTRGHSRSGWRRVDQRRRYRYSPCNSAVARLFSGSAAGLPTSVDSEELREPSTAPPIFGAGNVTNATVAST
jgi:hypothetical protein